MMSNIRRLSQFGGHATCGKFEDLVIPQITSFGLDGDELSSAVIRQSAGVS